MDCPEHVTTQFDTVKDMPVMVPSRAPTNESATKTVFEKAMVAVDTTWSPSMVMATPANVVWSTVTVKVLAPTPLTTHSSPEPKFRLLGRLLVPVTVSRTPDALFVR